MATVMSDAAHTRRYRRDAPNALTDFVSIFFNLSRVMRLFGLDLIIQGLVV